jgi:hypothetical protein
VWFDQARARPGDEQGQQRTPPATRSVERAYGSQRAGYATWRLVSSPALLAVDGIISCPSLVNPRYQEPRANARERCRVGWAGLDTRLRPWIWVLCIFLRGFWNPCHCSMRAGRHSYPKAVGRSDRPNVGTDEEARAEWDETLLR